MEHTLRGELAPFGEVVHIKCGETQTEVRFASQLQAEEACAASVANASRHRVAKQLFLVYNSSVHYDIERGKPYSGWCSFEQGVSLLASAHLTAAEAFARKRKRQLPSHFEQAQERRSKLIDISSGEPHARVANEQPHVLLAATIETIAGAHFTG